MSTATSSAETNSGGSPSSYSPLADRLRSVATAWAQSQHDLVVLAVEFADSGEWMLDGSPTAAHWIADVADIEVCTAREWIRIGRCLETLPATADAFANGGLSYSKVRTLTRIAEPDNEEELVGIAVGVRAGVLGRSLAAWLTRNRKPADLPPSSPRRASEAGGTRTRPALCRLRIGRPPFEQTRQTIIDQLELRCSSCHRRRHRAGKKRE